MFNILLTITLLTSVSQVPIAQSQTPLLEQLTGTIIQKPWSKSQESYCIGGSEYFVLQYGEDLTIVLQHPEADKLLDDFIDKKVTINGYRQTNTIAPSDRTPANGIAQTLSYPVLCTVFIVQELTGL